MKNPPKNLFLLFVLSLGFATSSLAQQKPAATLKPPVLHSFWGTTKGGDLPLDFVLGVVDSAVWVMDDKKIRYSISRFIMVYKSKDRFEDEKTGEIKTKFNTNAANVKNSGYLPAVWQKSLYENIKKEDEVIITDIIVRDKRGNFFAAPDVKIRIK